MPYRITKVVVAGTQRQFEEWCCANRVNPKRPYESGVVYGSDECVLRGLSNQSVAVVYHGTPAHRSPEFWQRLGAVTSAPPEPVT